MGWSLKTDRTLPRSAAVYLSVRGTRISLCGPCRSLHGFLAAPRLWLSLNAAAADRSAFLVISAGHDSLRLSVER
jgi:hypothetical protein